MKSWLRNRKHGIFLLGIAGGMAFLALLLGPIALWATPATGLRGKELADAISVTRQILLAAVGGFGLLTGAAFTARTYYLSRRGQLTDRYIKAIGLLGSDKLTERIGGVYALEHLMIESEREHDTVVEVLAAFVRDQAPSPEPDGGQPEAETRNEISLWLARPRTDVQAALTVLGRRPRRPEKPGLVDLSQTDLTGADLVDLNLDAVWFWMAKLPEVRLQGASLRRANFSHADLRGAKLTNTSLQAASLYGAQLQKAVLMRANLQDADLGDSDLRGAYLAEADLHRATLDGARLEGANFVSYPTGSPASAPKRLAAEQLAKAVIDAATRLPEGLREAFQDPVPLGAAVDADSARDLQSSAAPAGAADADATVHDLAPPSGERPRRAATETGTETGNEEGSCR